MVARRGIQYHVRDYSDHVVGRVGRRVVVLARSTVVLGIDCSVTFGDTTQVPASQIATVQSWEGPPFKGEGLNRKCVNGMC